MFFNVLHLFIPTPTIHAKRFQTTRLWDIVKAGLDNAQQCPTLDFLQLEFNQRRRFFRVVDGRVHCGRMPAPGNEALRLHAFDHHIKDDVFVAGIGDLALYAFASCKGFPLKHYAEPVAEFFGIRKRAPDARPRRLEQNCSFDAIC
jgi:hypothetical protein